MPRRDDIRKILLIGSGPIVIGQAAEFDYSGTQACRVLMEEGYEVVLVNSNPATIMTDPEVATRDLHRAAAAGDCRAGDRARAARRAAADARRPDRAEHRQGAARRRHARAARRRADRRQLRRDRPRRGPRAVPRDDDRGGPEGAAQRDRPHARRRENRASPRSGCRSSSARHSRSAAPAAGCSAPRTSSSGSSAADCRRRRSSQVLLEESVLGWGEFELEVMRDRSDNVVIVCSIENLDPMGVHTGDSVCVAPQQTLTDKQYQALRDQAITVIRAVGVETGGSNVQFAVNPATDEIVVIEMNPRVSRSSALASKATGFPIAKIAARLAVGYTLAGDPERHHASDAGELRARDRLLRGQVAAVRVREVPRRRRRAHHPHEVRRRGDGDRAHVQAGVRQGAALARARLERHVTPTTRRSCSRSPRRRAPSASTICSRRCAAASRSTSCTRRPASTRGSCTSCRAGGRGRRDRGAFAGVRTFKAVDTCAAEFAAETPVLLLGLGADAAGRRRPRPRGRPR